MVFRQQLDEQNHELERQVSDLNRQILQEKEIVKEEKSKWDSGSIYIVNAAEKIKDYCRDYAMNLYEKLYRVDGSFELAYSE